MLKRAILFWILGWVWVSSQSSLEKESWFYQLLTRLKSTDPEIVKSAQEALISYGSAIQEKLRTFQQNPAFEAPLRPILERLQSPKNYHLERAIHFSEGTQQALLKTVTTPLTLQFVYNATYFSQKTVEVTPIQGNSARMNKLIQQLWIHALDESGYFQVIEPRVSKEKTPASIQIGGEANWLFLQGNARLQLDLWMKQNKRVLSWKTLLTQMGNEEWSTALKLLEPQIQQWLQESLPQQKNVQITFAPPMSQIEWVGLFLAQEGRFSEAISLLSAPQNDTQRFHLGLIYEASGQLTQAIEHLQKISNASLEQKNALQRLKVRTYDDE